MSVTSPVIALDAATLTDGTRDARYGSRYAALGPLLGLTHLGCPTTSSRRHRICPFHNHHANDELYVVLEATAPTARAWRVSVVPT